jgi:divalent metal cation (Fe/Co/Zn/Cd) transporter
MPNDNSMRTVLVALGSGLGVALAKVAVAVVTGSSAMAAEAAHSLSDTANDLFLFVAQRRSTRRRTTGIPWVTGGKPTSGR